MTHCGALRLFFSVSIIFSIALLPNVLASPAVVARVDPADESQYLDPQNDARAQHGAAPLTWSDDLAAKAQQWADGCVFGHSGGQLGPFGENLAEGGPNGFSIAQAVKSWTDEASEYDPNDPQPSHFTQVVWKATSQVGCAHTQCDALTYHVCEYSPAGNVLGQFPANVQP